MQVSNKCAHVGGLPARAVLCSESEEATSVSDSWLHFSPLEKRLIFTEGPCAGTEMHNISVTHFLEGPVTWVCSIIPM